MPNEQTERIEEIKRLLGGLPLKRKQDIMHFISKYYISRQYINLYHREYEPATDDDEKAIDQFMKRLYAEETKF